MLFKIWVVRWIRTRIVVVDSKDADRYTTTTTINFKYSGKKTADFGQNFNSFGAFFADVDIEAMQSCRTLESVNLEENPLTRDASVALSNITSVRVVITPRDVEEWEDLSI